jgi:hypothetical protein
MTRLAGDDGAHQCAQLMLFIAKVARAAAERAEANLRSDDNVSRALIHHQYGS